MIENEKLTVTDTINSFAYEGINIKNLADKMQVVSSGERIISNKEKPILATTFTFSCTNVLFFCNDFAYLVHLNPAQAVGKNDFFKTILAELEKIVNLSELDNLNVLISLGHSSDEKQEKKFHDMNFIKESLKTFESENEINLNLLPTQRSKYLLFDYRDGTLIIDGLKNKSSVAVLKNHNSSISDENEVFKKGR